MPGKDIPFARLDRTNPDELETPASALKSSQGEEKPNRNVCGQNAREAGLDF